MNYSRSLIYNVGKSLWASLQVSPSSVNLGTLSHNVAKLLYLVETMVILLINYANAHTYFMYHM